MRLWPLLFSVLVLAPPASAQPSAPPSSSQERSSSPGVAAGDQAGAKPEAAADEQTALPVNLDRIKQALQQPPTLKHLSIDERPTFRIQIRETQKLEDLLSTLNFKSGPTPAGGIYMSEMQRQWWPSVDNPLQQPYAAFNQGELLTLLVESLAGKYLAGRAVGAITNAERARAEAAARDEVQQAVRDYCSAQPNNGAGIQICAPPER
jgi:hypothetical protein